MANEKGGPVATRFKPGQSGNPGGKPVGSRNRLTAHFLNALADDFEVHGKQAITDARTADPMGYVKVVGALMPKQIENTQPLDDLTDGELLAGIALLRSRLADSSGAGGGSPSQPSEVN
jgi:hypothetical protein